MQSYRYCVLATDQVRLAEQMIGGAVVPGKPVANMYFSAYGYNPVYQSYKLMEDLKIGQYTKLPPRVTFGMQMIGSIIVCPLPCRLL